MIDVVFEFLPNEIERGFHFCLQSGILHIGDQLVAVDGESLQDVSYNEVNTM